MTKGLRNLRDTLVRGLPKTLQGGSHRFRVGEENKGDDRGDPEKRCFCIGAGERGPLFPHCITPYLRTRQVRLHLARGLTEYETLEVGRNRRMSSRKEGESHITTWDKGKAFCVFRVGGKVTYVHGAEKYRPISVLKQSLCRRWSERAE